MPIKNGEDPISLSLLSTRMCWVIGGPKLFRKGEPRYKYFVRQVEDILEKIELEKIEKGNDVFCSIHDLHVTCRIVADAELHNYVLRHIFCSIHDLLVTCRMVVKAELRNYVLNRKIANEISIWLDANPESYSEEDLIVLLREVPENTLMHKAILKFLPVGVDNVAVAGSDTKAVVT